MVVPQCPVDKKQTHMGLGVFLSVCCVLPYKLLGGRAALKMWMPHPWMCSRAGWKGSWAA